jgi:hypothetical protein
MLSHWNEMNEQVGRRSAAAHCSRIGDFDFVRNLGCQIIKRQCRSQANDSFRGFASDGKEIGIAQGVAIGEPVQSTGGPNGTWKTHLARSLVHLKEFANLNWLFFDNNRNNEPGLPLTRTMLEHSWITTVCWRLFKKSCVFRDA